MTTVHDGPAPRRLFDRFRDAVRGWWSGPITSNSPELARLFSAPPTRAGVPVNETTALRYSAVWAAVKLISEDVAALPLVLLRRLSDGGKQRADNEPLYDVLHARWNPETSSYHARQALTAAALLTGDGYAEIERNGAGRPAALWPLTPDRVIVTRPAPGGPLVYRIRRASGGGYDELPAADVLHLRFMTRDGLTGISTIAHARESIALSLAAERFGAEFFGNGSTFGGILSFPDNPNDQVKENMRRALEARHQGLDRAHKFLALYGGAKYERVGIPPDDAQFLETRVFQIREVARWFKIPPHMLGDLADATFSNIEQSMGIYFGQCLRPILEAWEQELELKLFAPAERARYVVEHVTEQFMRADAQGRATFYSAMLDRGAFSINEVRARENLPPVPGGDMPRVETREDDALETRAVRERAVLEGRTTPHRTTLRHLKQIRAAATPCDVPGCAQRAAHIVHRGDTMRRLCAHHAARTPLERRLAQVQQWREAGR